MTDRSQSLTLKALHVVLQHWMIPNLGWNKEYFDNYMVEVRRRKSRYQHVYDQLSERKAYDITLVQNLLNEIERYSAEQLLEDERSRSKCHGEVSGSICTPFSSDHSFTLFYFL